MAAVIPELPVVAWPSVRLEDYPIKEIRRSRIRGRALCIVAQVSLLRLSFQKIPRNVDCRW